MRDIPTTPQPTDDLPFWQKMDQLTATAEIVIDRPKGSAHPRYSDVIHPFDYGCLENISAADGGEIGEWLNSPGTKY